MKIYYQTLSICLLCSIAYSQTFQQFLNRINAAPDSMKMGIVDSLMAVNQRSPYLEKDTLAHFSLRGNFQKLGFTGDLNHWNQPGDQYTRIEGTNLWYYSVGCEPDARIDYRIILNDSETVLDPLNSHKIWGGFGPKTELRMPRYLPPPEIMYYADIDHGTLLDTIFFSTALKNSRTVKVYLPPNYYQSDENYALVLFHDGLDYLTFANAQNILDYLIWQQRISPVVALFIPAVNRDEEYAGNLKTPYSRFVVDDLIGWVDHRFRTKKNPQSRITMGCSAGGNISLWLGLYYPEVFANVACQSSYVERSISLGFKEMSNTGTKFYFDMGVYDIPILPPLIDNLAQILRQQNFSYQYQFYPEGHSWGSWRAHIDDALEMFIPGSALSNKSAH